MTTRTYKAYGLTGGIGSGKSSVTHAFKKQGIPVIDADQIAHELTAPGGKAHTALITKFGTADRSELRKLVFNNPSQRKELESLLHPLIAQESKLRIEAQGANHPCVIYEAALLVETGRYQEFDGLIVVDAPAPLRASRIMARDQVSQEMAQKIIDSQTNDEVRKSRATWIFDNSKDLHHLEQQVQQWLKSQNLLK